MKFPIPGRSHAAMTFIVEALLAGSYRPMIDRRYPVERISDADRPVEAGEKVGTVLLDIGEDPAGGG